MGLVAANTPSVVPLERETDARPARFSPPQRIRWYSLLLGKLLWRRREKCARRVARHTVNPYLPARLRAFSTSSVHCIFASSRMYGRRGRAFTPSRGSITTSRKRVRSSCVPPFQPSFRRRLIPGALGRVVLLRECGVLMARSLHPPFDFARDVGLVDCTHLTDRQNKQESSGWARQAWKPTQDHRVVGFGYRLGGCRVDVVYTDVRLSYRTHEFFP